MAVVGGLDIHRAQITFSCGDSGTGEVKNGKIENPHRAQFAHWLSRLGTINVEFGTGGCTGWLYIGECGYGRLCRRPGRVGSVETQQEAGYDRSWGCPPYVSAV